jgi:hypothetical protein
MRLALQGAGPDVKYLLLRSADGSYGLALWRDVSVWDRTALRDLSPAPDHLDVTLGEPVKLARRFDPVDSDAETQRWTDPQRIPVDLAGEPVVLRLVPRDAAAGAGGATRGLHAGARAGKSCAARLLATGSKRSHRRQALANCCRPPRHKHARKGKRRRARHAGKRRAHASWTVRCVSAGRHPHR